MRENSKLISGLIWVVAAGLFCIVLYYLFPPNPPEPTPIPSVTAPPPEPTPIPSVTAPPPEPSAVTITGFTHVRSCGSKKCRAIGHLSPAATVPVSHCVYSGIYGWVFVEPGSYDHWGIAGADRGGYFYSPLGDPDLCND